MNLACAASAFGSRAARAEGFTRAVLGRLSNWPLSWFCKFFGSITPRFFTSRRMRHLYISSINWRRLIVDTALRRASLKQQKCMDSGAAAERARLIACRPAPKTRVYYKLGAEEDSPRIGMRRPAAAASASRTAWAKEIPSTILASSADATGSGPGARGMAKTRRRSRCNGGASLRSPSDNWPQWRLKFLISSLQSVPNGHRASGQRAHLT